MIQGRKLYTDEIIFFGLELAKMGGGIFSIEMIYFKRL